ncbi:MAG TPA: universal stress protein [Chloroflexia bacterium]|jgi:nucleotide-binding universal stress UspA family protein
MSQHFKRILVPLDGSRLAESALSVAVVLARCLDAKISLLHIVEEHAPQRVHGEPHLTTAQEAERYLAALAERLAAGAAGVAVERHVHGTEEQDVAGSIAAHVAELEADMVALCTHGRSGLRRVVSGSIAQQVLRRVTAPVLLVRPDMPPLSTVGAVMLPLDNTHPVEAVLSVTADIARTCGATVQIVNVVPTIGTLTGDEQAAARLTPIATAATLDAEEEESRAHLQTVVDKLARLGIDTRCEVRRGDTPRNLVEAATERGAALVVLATHARAGLGAFWIGSVAASIIGKASQPLLLVRVESAKTPDS